jgi:hypothetical protein
MLGRQSLSANMVPDTFSLPEETQRHAQIYERKLATLEELKESLLHVAFSGTL